MSALPTGTVTFLLTDVVGSAKLWEERPEEMRRALAAHDALAYRLIRRHGGALVKSRGEGDSLFAVFARASDAVLAADALQRALLQEGEAGGVRLNLRSALHTGQADQRDGDYYGAAVNRCARLRDLAHGCQILLSHATAEFVRNGLPLGLRLRDLGRHKLKDLAEPEHVFQLLSPDLPDGFPPLRSSDSDAFRHNLPQQLTSFVGREAEIAHIKDCLPQTPLLTLTGAGGCGKTRLALQVAADLVDDYPDGVWLAELAPLADPARVGQTVAAALRVREEPSLPVLETLCSALRGKSLLLILDNCEHLVQSCAALAQALLNACPGVRILATSREALGIAGEALLQVPSLSLPSLHPLPSLTQLTEYEAVRLFLSRAVTTEATFTMTPDNASSVVQICRRLDGIPLALELAAARVKVLTVEQISQRLDDRFRLLTGGARTALPRQQTLRALIDWSYDLLEPEEKTLLRRLSVFAGGWTLEAAEQVCASDDDTEGADVLGLLGRLVDKSLVVVDEAKGQARRYRLLEMVRQYGRDRLSETGDGDRIRTRHHAWFLALAESAVASLRGLDQGFWLNRLETEHDNFRAALEASLAEDEDGGETCQRLSGALWHFWYVRGYISEGREWLTRALSQGSGPTAGRARALCGASCLAWGSGEGGAARSLAEESLAISERLKDQRGVAEALKHLGMVARHRGEYGPGRALFENSLALSREMNQEGDIAHMLCCLGEMAWFQGDNVRARALQEESLRLAQALGSRRDQAYSLTNLGNISLTEGQLDAARPLLEEGLAISREIGEAWATAYSLWSLGNASLMAGRFAEAHGQFGDALRLVRDLESRWSIGFGLEGLGHLAAAQGQWERAVRLMSAAQALRDTIRYPLPPILSAPHEACLSAARVELGEPAFHAAWAAGRALSLPAAIQEALTEDYPDVERGRTGEEGRTGGGGRTQGSPLPLR